MPKLKEILFGKRGKNKKLETQSTGQKQIQKLINQGLTKNKGPLADLFGEFDEQAFKEGVTDPQIKQFQEQILPMLQEQMNANGQVLSNAFGREQLKAGNDMQSKIAQLMYEAKQGQKHNRFAGVQQTLGTPQFENLYKKETTGAAHGFFNAMGESAGKATFGGGSGGAGGTAPAMPAGGIG
jgi:hypothetical protein